MSSSTGATIQRTPAPGRYRIDPQRTTVRFSARHLFGLGGVHGRFTLLEADLVITDPIELSTVDAVIDAASFTTGNPMRDKVVRSAKYLHVATYPVITFTGHDVTSRQGTWTAAGLVNAHGIEAPLELTVDHLDVTGAEFSLQASATVDRYAHRVTAGKGLAGRWIGLNISTVATQ